MPFNLWDILILVSLAQGLIFGILVIRSPFFRKTPSKFLAFSIILLAVIGLNEWFSSWNFDDQYYFIDFFGDDMPWILLVYVPLFLYFLKASRHRWDNHSALPLLVLPFLIFLVLNIYINLDVDFGLYKIPNVRRFMSIVYDIESWTAIGYSLALSLAAFGIIRAMEDRPDSKRWLLRIWGITLVLILCWLLLSLLPESRYAYLDYYLWGGISFFIYWLTYQGLYRFKLAEDQVEIQKLWKERSAEVLTEAPTAKNDSSSGTEAAYMQQLGLLIQNQHIHRNPDLSRDSVAEELGISPGYLSQIINSATGDNFATYINTHRVAAVRQMLRDPEFAQYSLLAIGMEAGFKSKSAFYTTFKKMTGQTPSAYQKSSHSSNSDKSGR